MRSDPRQTRARYRIGREVWIGTEPEVCRCWECRCCFPAQPAHWPVPYQVRRQKTVRQRSPSTGTCRTSSSCLSLCDWYRTVVCHVLWNLVDESIELKFSTRLPKFHVFLNFIKSCTINDSSFFSRIPYENFQIIYRNFLVFERPEKCAAVCIYMARMSGWHGTKW